MELTNLDVREGLTSCFTIGYRITGDRTDNWTSRFNRFKFDQSVNSTAFYGAINLMEVSVPILVDELGLGSSETVFVPALSSGETIASENGVISCLTRHCARALSLRFKQDTITKEVHDPLHRYLRADKRREILDKANYKSKRIRTNNILIFDDFITRGDTLSHIAQAIHDKNPTVCVYGIALGKTDRREFHKKWYDKELSNDHIPGRWETLWKQGEEGLDHD